MLIYRIPGVFTLRDKQIFLPFALVKVILYLHQQNLVSGVRTRISKRAIPDAWRLFVVKPVHLHSAVKIRVESMVALAGQPKGWPVSFCTGILTRQCHHHL